MLSEPLTSMHSLVYVFRTRLDGCSVSSANRVCLVDSDMTDQAASVFTSMSSFFPFSSSETVMGSDMYPPSLWSLYSPSLLSASSQDCVPSWMLWVFLGLCVRVCTFLGLEDLNDRQVWYALSFHTNDTGHSWICSRLGHDLSDQSNSNSANCCSSGSRCQAFWLLDQMSYVYWQTLQSTVTALSLALAHKYCLYI